MPDRASLALRLSSPKQTAALAERIAPLLVAGDCLLLNGPIGAGKTHFARALIQRRLAEADRSEDVPSPTFTLIQTYDDGQAEIWHADLYRLSNPAEIDELGLADAFDSAICIVEWADKLGKAAPNHGLRLDFAAGRDENERRLTVEGDRERWQSVLAAISQTEGACQS